MALRHYSGAIKVRNSWGKLTINVSCSAVSQTEVCASVSGIRCPGPALLNAESCFQPGKAGNVAVIPFLRQRFLTRHGNDSAIDSDGDIRCPVHYISEPAHVALVHREGFSDILRQPIHAQTVTQKNGKPGSSGNSWVSCWRYGETCCAADGGNLKCLHRAGHCNNGTAVTNKRTSSSEVCAGTCKGVSADGDSASSINHVFSRQ
ncbi:Uncharacterised protein [Enterobacter hormaechei]|nr:Uncharacterised protein [Enterobacter hormaechei]